MKNYSTCMTENKYGKLRFESHRFLAEKLWEFDCKVSLALFNCP